MGQFNATLAKRESCSDHLWLWNNLLGLPAISVLELVVRVDSCRTTDINQRYPALFHRVGCLKETIFNQDSRRSETSCTLHTSQCTYTNEIKSPARTETNGAAQGKSSVTDSTPWCVGMMVMPKKSGAVRIHVDIKPLNDWVMREVYPIHSVDDSLANYITLLFF